MIQLAYVSSTRGLLTVEELMNILVTSRDKNQRRGITGMLLYKGGNVLQILEGEESQVLPLFQVIQNDVRHSGVIKLYQKEAASRDFSEWTMGFHDLDKESSSPPEGFSEFFNRDFDMHEIKATAAAKLLSAFRSNVR